MIFANFVNYEMDFFEVGIFAATAIGRIGKHGDFGLFIIISLISFGGIFNYSIELFFGGNFVDSAIGESEMLAFFFADKTTREIIRF